MKHVSKIIFVFIFFFSQSSFSLTLRTEKFTCPIGGEKFESNVVNSYTTFGIFLDLKPFGALAAPLPLAVCPSNGFVIYKKKISEDELKKIKQLINTPDYQKWFKEETTYFLLAKIFEHLNKDANDIAFAYLQATWQANESQYHRYAVEAIKHFQKVSNSNLSEDKKFTAQLLLIELKRRIQDFEGALQSWEQAMKNPQRKKEPFPNILKLEKKLIKNKDNKTYKVPSK